MRIDSFRIENFRNIRLAECVNPPDFMVICGGNGCGKTALLSALMTAKEHAGAYGGFKFDPRAVSADAQVAQISLKLHFDDIERQWHNEQYNKECPEQDEIVVEIQKGGTAHVRKRSRPTGKLLSWYSRQYKASPGFFEYIGPYRTPTKKQLSTWDANVLSDDRCKHALSASGQQKFEFTKDYLASIVMRDLQHEQRTKLAGNPEYPNSLEPIRDFFNDFFAPLEFVDVQIFEPPFRYIVRTPRGEIDIDDLSAGEKEVLNTFIRFHQLQPERAVILFDEADAHLHPDLERRYLEVLRSLGKGNQLWLTTHSPEMMIAAGTESLYTVLKEPPAGGGNQFVQVTNSEELHSTLSEVMGSHGLVSFNQRIVFIEGEEASADREVYERLYPPGARNVSFVPTGNSAAVRKTAERVNQLLSAAMPFQNYFSIVDQDIDRASPPPPGGKLYQLPVYHVENFLLDEKLVLDVTADMMGSQSPYKSPADVEAVLKEIVLSDEHIKPYAQALLDACVANLAKAAYDAVYTSTGGEHPIPQRPTFQQAEQEARQKMEQAVQDGSWRKKCKGRDVLKAYCRKHNFSKYEHFRNCVIAKMTQPPQDLADIMDQILI